MIPGDDAHESHLLYGRSINSGREGPHTQEWEEIPIASTTSDETIHLDRIKRYTGQD